MKNNGLKNSKAITLIALIVTIIVLLILAGVSIAVLTGENGILNRATEAKQTNEQKTAEEELKLGVSALSIDYRKNATHSGTFKEFVVSTEGLTELKKAMGLTTANTELKVENAENGIVSYKGQKYQIDDYGEITEYKPVTANIIINGLNTEISRDDDMSSLYGRKVKNYNVAGLTYRIFYIDFLGEFGSEGTIYLKADAMSTIKTSIIPKVSTNEEDIELFKKMNIKWANNRGNINTENWTSSEKMASYLCSKSEWSTYKNENAKYAIASPSVDMYVRSFKQTHETDLDYDYSSYWTPGYVFAPPTADTQLKPGYTSWTPIGRRYVPDTYGEMYYSENYSYILSSASSDYCANGPITMCMVTSNQYGASIQDTDILANFGGIERGICPIVALQSNFIPEIDN